MKTAVEKKKTRAETLATEHVVWLINVLGRVVGITGKEEFIHGYKHGWDDAMEYMDGRSRDGS